MEGILVLVQLGLALGFLVANVAVLLAVLKWNQRGGPGSKGQTPPAVVSSQKKRLEASDILGWEFEYARVTASEAMEQRHTMVNFYLLAAGITISGVVAVLSQETRLPGVVGTVLLWLLCGIGWIYFLAIIRLRQAWFDSARAMNQIKDFYIHNTEQFAPEELRTAFRWKSGSLPQPDNLWTVHFYSAMLIALVDSVAYIAGGVLLGLGTRLHLLLLALVLLLVLGALFFAFHVWLYLAFLKPKRPNNAAPNDSD
jgi:hypothetical protein